MADLDLQASEIRIGRDGDSVRIRITTDGSPINWWLSVGQARNVARELEISASRIETVTPQSPKPDRPESSQPD